MIFGIKYKSNEKYGKQVTNYTMDNYGCAIMFNGKLDYYFDNPFAAIKTALILRKTHNGFASYSVFKVPRDYERRIAIDKILSSYEEYRSIMYRKQQQIINEIEDMKGSNQAKEPTL